MGVGQSLAASARYETLGAGTGTGTVVTAGTNTKGTTVSIGTTAFQYDGFFLLLGGLSGAGRYRFDVIINTGGSDTVLVADYFFDALATYPNSSPILPISVPTGATLKVASQCSTGTPTVAVTILGLQGNERMARGFSRAVSCTDWTNTDPTNSVTLNGTTQTAWAAIGASTPARVAGLYLALDGRGGATTTTNLLIDIGIGGAGSEIVLIPSILMRRASAIPNFSDGPFPCDIPAGTRLSFRATASAASTNVISMAALGLAA